MIHRRWERSRSVKLVFARWRKRWVWSVKKKRWVKCAAEKGFLGLGGKKEGWGVKTNQSRKSDLITEMGGEGYRFAKDPKVRTLKVCVIKNNPDPGVQKKGNGERNRMW